MAPTKLVADVVRLLTVPMFVALVAIFVTFVEIPDVFEVMLVELVLILDSTSDILPTDKVPSMSASFKTVTVPEV